jgi:conflict system pore-forming effector with SLATT domain
MDPEVRKQLIVWQGRVNESRAVHYETAKQYERRDLLLGVPVVMLTTLVGTSVFAALGQSVHLWAQIAVGLCSVVAAVLAGLQTFLRFAERAEKHRMVAVRYGALNRKIEALLALGGDLPRDQVLGLCKRIDDLSAEAPSTPNWVWELVTKRSKADVTAQSQEP